MKYITIITAFFYSTILISCQNSKENLSFIRDIKLPYTIEIQDYGKFVNESFEKKDIYESAKVSSIIGKHNNISKVYFIGKFTIEKQNFVLFQDVTPNESSEFFPAIYITKIGKETKTLCLTPITEESYIDKIIINNNKIIVRENYWSSTENKRKNDKLKEYNFYFSEITHNKKNVINLKAKTNQFQSENTSDSLVLSKECDLNMDSIKDKILVYSPKKINENQSYSTVYVLIYNKNGDFKEYKNNKIINIYYPNSYAEGFRDIVIKNNYFTIEENISSQPIQDKYTTFSFDKKSNSIYLHKLGFSTVFPDAKQDKDITYSSKEFGTIKFESYDSQKVKY